MKHTACLHRPAIAGIAALGLTTTALLAPAAHASAPTSEPPTSFTSAYTAMLVPNEAVPADAPTPIEEDRGSQVTPADAPAPEEAAGAAATTDTPVGTLGTADAADTAPEETSAETALPDTDASGEQGATGDGATAEAAIPEGAAGDGAPAEAPAEAPVEEEASTQEEASEETALADEPTAAQEQVTGEVMLRVNAEEDVVCFDVGLNGVTGDGPATVHLHEAAGPQLLAFPDSSGCLPVSASTLAQIEENPNAFYIDVHTDQSPDGAARGFLTQVPLGGVDAGGGRTATQDSALTVAGAAAAAVLLGLGGAFALSRRSRGSE